MSGLRLKILLNNCTPKQQPLGRYQKLNFVKIITGIWIYSNIASNEIYCQLLQFLFSFRHFVNTKFLVSNCRQISFYFELDSNSSFTRKIRSPIPKRSIADSNQNSDRICGWNYTVASAAQRYTITIAVQNQFVF